MIIKKKRRSLDDRHNGSRRARRIIVVTNQVPGHDLGLQQSGHARYLNGFLEHFRDRNFDLVLLVLRPNVDFFYRFRDSLDYTLIGPSFFRLGDFIILRSLIGLVRLIAWKAYVRLPRFLQTAVDSVRLALRKMRGSIHTLGRLPSDRELLYVRRIVEQVKPDFVVYDGIFNSCGVLNVECHWVITHEVKYQRAASFKKSGISIAPTSFNLETERAILELSGNIIAIQWDDQKEFQRLTPNSRVVVVPVTMTLPGVTRSADATFGRCLFVGSGSYHNLHGIRWFLESCWPSIREKMPNATLDVVGSVCFRLSSVPLGVRLCGVVKNLDAYYAEASVTVIPLQIGSGLKVKLVEALVHEQAIVTTSVGGQGLLDLSPRAFVVADSSAEFSAQTIALLSLPSRQGQLRAEAAFRARMFAPQTAFSELDKAMSSDVKQLW